MDGDFSLCARCKVMKEEQFFYRLKTGNLHSWCKQCCCEMQRNYRQGVTREFEKDLDRAPSAFGKSYSMERWVKQNCGKAKVSKVDMRKAVKKVTQRRKVSDKLTVTSELPKETEKSMIELWKIDLGL
jgi:hypothetical protein